MEKDCKEWIFVDATAYQVLLQGTETRRGRVDLETARLANYGKKEISDFGNAVKTSNTIVRHRRGGGVMIHHLEPDFRSTKVDKAIFRRELTEAYIAIWEEVSHCNQKCIRLPLLSSTRAGTHQNHTQVTVEALVASLGKGDARLAKWLQEAEAIEICVPSTKEHEKAVLISEQFQENTTTPVTRTTATAECGRDGF